MSNTNDNTFEAVLAQYEKNKKNSTITMNFKITEGQYLTIKNLIRTRIAALMLEDMNSDMISSLMEVDVTLTDQYNEIQFAPDDSLPF